MGERQFFFRNPHNLRRFFPSLNPGIKQHTVDNVRFKSEESWLRLRDHLSSVKGGLFPVHFAVGIFEVQCQMYGSGFVARVIKVFGLNVVLDFKATGSLSVIGELLDSLEAVQGQMAEIVVPVKLADKIKTAVLLQATSTVPCILMKKDIERYRAIVAKLGLRK